MTTQPHLTLYHLNASRAVRIAWTLAALSLPYNLVASERDSTTGVAPQEFKDKMPFPHKKSPTLVDGDLTIQESGAIIEYLCETYDDAGLLMPKHSSTAAGWAERERCKIREWIAMSEGTYLMHGISIMYARSRLPKDLPNRAEVWAQMNKAMSVNLHNALNLLDNHLAEVHGSGGKFLVGNRLSAAEMAMLFSIQLIYNRELSLQGLENGGKGRWKEIEKWHEYCEQEKSWKQATEKVGWRLYGML